MTVTDRLSAWAGQAASVLRDLANGLAYAVRQRQAEREETVAFAEAVASLSVAQRLEPGHALGRVRRLFDVTLGDLARALDWSLARLGELERGKLEVSPAIAAEYLHGVLRLANMQLAATRDGHTTPKPMMWTGTAIERTHNRPQDCDLGWWVIGVRGAHEIAQLSHDTDTGERRWWIVAGHGPSYTDEDMVGEWGYDFFARLPIKVTPACGDNWCQLCDRDGETPVPAHPADPGCPRDACDHAASDHDGFDGCPCCARGTGSERDADDSAPGQPAAKSWTCRLYDPWSCSEDEQGEPVNPWSCRTCGASQAEHPELSVLLGDLEARDFADGRRAIATLQETLRCAERAYANMEDEAVKHLDDILALAGIDGDDPANEEVTHAQVCEMLRSRLDALGAAQRVILANKRWRTQAEETIRELRQRLRKAEVGARMPGVPTMPAATTEPDNGAADPGCPRDACDHSASDHDGLFNSICQIDGCPCGQSDAIDERARCARNGDWWVAAGAAEEASILDDPRMDGETWIPAADVTPAMLDAWPVWESQVNTSLWVVPRVQDMARHREWRPLRLPGMNTRGEVRAENLTELHERRCATWEWKSAQWPLWERWSDAKTEITGAADKTDPTEVWRPAIFAQLDAEDDS